MIMERSKRGYHERNNKTIYLVGLLDSVRGLLGASLLSLWLNPSWKLVLSTWFCIAGIIFFSYQAKNSLGEIVWREATEGLIKQIRKEREQQK